MAFTKPRLILQQGLRSAQPTASTVAEGTLYYVTDEQVIERSNLTTWDAWSIQALIDTNPDVILELLAYTLCRLSFVEQALDIDHGGDLPSPEALLLLEGYPCPWNFN